MIRHFRSNSLLYLLTTGLPKKKLLYAAADRLSKECGLSESTLANIFRRNTMPSISTLEAICNGFGITLSQFFCESEMVELSPELKELFDNWVNLTTDQKQAALQIMRAFNSEKK